MRVARGKPTAIHRASQSLNLVFAVCILLGCAGGKPETKSEPAVSLPGWFWETPRRPGVRLAVGYAQFYPDIDASCSLAFADAALRLWCDRSPRISGGSATGYDGAGMMSLGSSFTIDVDTTGFSVFVGGLARLDSAWSGDLTVALVGTSPTQISREYREPFPVRELGGLSEKAAIRGLTASPRYYHSKSSWFEAESQARIQAALSVKAEIKGESAAADGLMHKVGVIEVDVHLRNVQTIGRAIDADSKTVWVLVTAEGIED